MYLFQLFRCKKNNGIKKNGSIWLFQKLGSQSAPKPIVGPKTPLKGPKLARFSCSPTNYFWAKKSDSNRTPQRPLPFTWNQPDMALSSSKERLVTFLHEKEILFLWSIFNSFCIYWSVTLQPGGNGHRGGPKKQ